MPTIKEETRTTQKKLALLPMIYGGVEPGMGGSVNILVANLTKIHRHVHGMAAHIEMSRQSEQEPY